MALSIHTIYAQEDKEFKERLFVYLNPMVNNGKISLFDDNSILPGDNPNQKIKDSLNNADVILFLLSADSINQYFDDLHDLIQEHHKGGIVLIPVLLKACDWREILKNIKVTPANEKPIDSSPNKNESFNKVVQEIKLKIEKTTKEFFLVKDNNDSIEIESDYYEQIISKIKNKFVRQLEKTLRMKKYYNSPIFSIPKNGKESHALHCLLSLKKIYLKTHKNFESLNPKQIGFNSKVRNELNSLREINKYLKGVLQDSENQDCALMGIISKLEIGISPVNNDLLEADLNDILAYNTIKYSSMASLQKEIKSMIEGLAKACIVIINAYPN